MGSGFPNQTVYSIGGLSYVDVSIPSDVNLPASAETTVCSLSLPAGGSVQQPWWWAVMFWCLQKSGAAATAGIDFNISPGFGTGGGGAFSTSGLPCPAFANVPNGISVGGIIPNTSGGIQVVNFFAVNNDASVAGTAFAEAKNGSGSPSATGGIAFRVA